MNNLILIRHGQSKWNLENRFTGWEDVELTKKGEFEAKQSGELIKKLEIKFSFCFTSLQKRAVNTLLIILKKLGEKKIIINKAWQLNERNYGALTGLNKNEIKKKYGEKKVLAWRRSWDLSPPPMKTSDSRHPIHNNLYGEIEREKILDSESLRDTYNRVIPFWEKKVRPLLKVKNNIIICAHGNSLRSLYKKLFNINSKQISNLEIPTGNPLIIKFNENLEIDKYFYLNKERSEKIIFKS